MSVKRDMAGTWCALALVAAALLSVPATAFSSPGWPLFGIQVACSLMLVLCALPVLAVGDTAACMRSAAIGAVAACVGYASDAPTFAALAGLGLVLSLGSYALRPEALHGTLAR